MESTVKVQRALRDVNSFDADLRFMAINDLQEQLRLSRISLASDDKVRNAIIGCIKDSVSDVQNQAVKTLATLVSHSTETNVLAILDQVMLLGTIPVRDVALRAIITHCSVGSALIKQILDRLLPHFAGATAPPPALENLDVLVDLVKYFGNAMTTSQITACRERAQKIIVFSKALCKKRALEVLACLSLHMNNAQWNDVASFTLNCLKDTQLRTSGIHLLAALSHKVPDRVASNSELYAEALNTASSIDETSIEQSEMALVAVEGLLDAGRAQPLDVLTLTRKLMRYYPNSNDLDDSDDDVNFSGDGDIDDFGEIDDDDLSWKIRRLSVRLPAGLIPQFSDTAAELVPDLVELLKIEPDASVKMEAVTTLTKFAQTENTCLPPETCAHRHKRAKCNIKETPVQAIEDDITMTGTASALSEALLLATPTLVSLAEQSEGQFGYFALLRALQLGNNLTSTSLVPAAARLAQVVAISKKSQLAAALELCQVLPPVDEATRGHLNTLISEATKSANYQVVQLGLETVFSVESPELLPDIIAVLQRINDDALTVIALRSLPHLATESNAEQILTLLADYVTSRQVFQSAALHSIADTLIKNDVVPKASSKLFIAARDSLNVQTSQVPALRVLRKLAKVPALTLEIAKVVTSVDVNTPAVQAQVYQVLTASVSLLGQEGCESLVNYVLEQKPEDEVAVDSFINLVGELASNASNPHTLLRTFEQRASLDKTSLSAKMIAECATKRELSVNLGGLDEWTTLLARELASRGHPVVSVDQLIKANASPQIVGEAIAETLWATKNFDRFLCHERTIDSAILTRLADKLLSCPSAELSRLVDEALLSLCRETEDIQAAEALRANQRTTAELALQADAGTVETNAESPHSWQAQLGRALGSLIAADGNCDKISKWSHKPAIVLAASKYAFRKSTSSELRGDLVNVFVDESYANDPARQCEALYALSWALQCQPTALRNVGAALRAVLSLTNFDDSRIEEVQIGPFKHKVDYGMPLRKAAYECVYSLITAFPQPVTNGPYASFLVDRVFAGLKDDHEIKISCCHVLDVLVKSRPELLSRRISNLAVAFKEILNMKVKERSVKQEHDRQATLVQNVKTTLKNVLAACKPLHIPLTELQAI